MSLRPAEPANGEIIASGANYTTKASTFNGIESVRKSAATASVDGSGRPAVLGLDVAVVQAEGHFKAALVIVKLPESGSCGPRGSGAAAGPASLGIGTYRLRAAVGPMAAPTARLCREPSHCLWAALVHHLGASATRQGMTAAAPCLHRPHPVPCDAWKEALQGPWPSSVAVSLSTAFCHCCPSSSSTASTLSAGSPR